MVARQVVSRGVRDPRVIAAIEEVPREIFVPDPSRGRAYQDRPLPIGCGQTISQPYMVAFMVEALELRGNDRVLEIGAGSGYAVAVLAEIVREVFAVERIQELVDKATITLREAGYGHVHIKHADGTEGWLDEAPFDAILVSASAKAIPAALKAQLQIGGRLVVPVGKPGKEQHLMRVRRLSEESFAEEDLGEVHFVPLIST